MARKQSDDSFSEDETLQRIGAVLRGAFAGPPTPLKEIPKRNGKQRKVGKTQRRPRRKARKSRAA
jgi:hypothetical protein